MATKTSTNTSESPTSGTTTAQASPTSTEPTVFSRRWDGIRRSGTRASSHTEDSITEINESANGKVYQLSELRNNADPEAGLPRTRTFSFHRRDTTLTSLDELERAVHGYPRLATFMGHEPGAAIYRRFASLNARVLLYRQAEIVCLEHELDQLEQEYGQHKHLHYSVKHLMHAKLGTKGHELWEKISQLEAALEKYNALLLQQKALYELPSADDIDINDLNNFAHNEEMGGRWLSHPEDTIWETIRNKSGKYKAEQKDLVRLSGSERYQDGFTRWLWGPFLQFFHSIYSRLRKPDNDAGAYSYNEAGIDMLSKATSMAIASLLPTASIIALYFISNNLWRLIFILIFSGVFTTCLSIFTAASRIEIFLASVGLASVQAVFVGNLIAIPTQPSGSAIGG